MVESDQDIVQRVTIYFDPACPWTWRTSRWLVDSAAAHHVPIEYAAFELSAGKPIAEVPTEHQASAAASRLFLRGVTAARQQGRHDLIGRWYTAFGTIRWDDHIEPTTELVQETLISAGGTEFLAALDDDTLADAVASSRSEAIQWAGDDAGSPVTVWDLGHTSRGFFGPVVAPKPTDGRRDAVWDTVTTAARVPEFFELKARRTNSPTESTQEQS